MQEYFFKKTALARFEALLAADAAKSASNDVYFAAKGGKMLTPQARTTHKIQYAPKIHASAMSRQKKSTSRPKSG